MAAHDADVERKSSTASPTAGGGTGLLSRQTLVGRDAELAALAAALARAASGHGRVVALKVTSPSVSPRGADRDALAAQFARLATLRHPNLVALLGVPWARRAAVLVMEYCAGGNLGDRLKVRGGRLPLAEAVALLRGCLVGLAHAHAKGYVHRNIKPANILLDGAAEPVAKLGDLGVAAALESVGLLGMTATCRRPIDYQYLPPDAWSRYAEDDPRHDLWSLAAVFHRALAGRMPRDFGGRDPIAVVLHDDIPPLQSVEPTVPPAVARVIDRALCRDVRARFPSAPEMLDALDAA